MRSYIDAESAAQDGLALIRSDHRQSRGEDRRLPSDCRPNPSELQGLARDANAIQVELGTRQDRDSDWCPGQGCWEQCCCRLHPRRCGSIGRIVEVGIEVAHAVVGFIGMRNAVPTQTEVQGQAVVYAPVVLNISGPGNVVPVAVILNSQLVVAGSRTQQEISEVDFR